MSIESFADFIGVQSGYGYVPDFESWNLVVPVRGLVVGGTYARDTVERALGVLCS